MTQLALSGVAVEFGATRLFSDVTFTVARGEKWGIVGRNGTGKTTLFRLLTGEAEPTAGTVAAGAGLRFSVMEQHREFAGATTVWEAAAGRVRRAARAGALAGGAGDRARRGGRPLHAADARPLRPRPRALRAGGRLHPRRPDRRGAPWPGLRSRRGADPGRSRA